MDGRRFMALLDTLGGQLRPLDVAHAGTMLDAAGGWAVYVGASPTAAAAVVRLDLSGGRLGAVEVLRHSTEFAVDEAYLSIAEPVEFPTAGGLTAYGYFYPPRNRDYAAPADELPPLIVTSHGGPTLSLIHI